MSEGNVLVFDPNGIAIREFKALEEHQYDYGFDPYNRSIALDDKGNINVIDRYCYVHSFTPRGEFIHKWKACFTENNDVILGLPVDLVFFNQNFYVAAIQITPSPYRSFLSKFTSEGQFINEWEILLSGNLLYTGLTLDKNGFIIAGNGNGEIYTYNNDGEQIDYYRVSKSGNYRSNTFVVCRTEYRF